MSAQMFNVESRVFVRHPLKSWIPARVTGRSDKNLYTVVDDDRDELHKVPPDDLHPCREDLLDEGVNPVVHDLLQLTVLHDSTLLRCLKVRFLKNVCYTNLSNIVVAINPFSFNIPWYQDSEMDKYLAEGDVIRNTLLPHSWAVAHNTYFELRNDAKDQTILVSGESGAGKTEACKIVLKYLGKLSMKSATDEQRRAAEVVRVKIQEASPILEGFGNAKTVRNNNSSRFGKFVRIKFRPEGYLAGAHTTNYLLEKSRIVTAAKNERIFHAFYLLTKGRDATRYGLKKPHEYKSTFAGKCLSREDADDAEDYLEVEHALEVVGFSAAERENIWRTVAGCLVAQNVELAAIDADTTCIQPSTREALEHASKLWGVPAEKLEKEILTTTTTVRGETFTSKLRLAQAADQRDSLCKHVYEKLFQYLINRINDSTDVEGDFTNSSIGVLDIFGFEDFEVNSYEQLLINLANEALQNHYNNFIFKKDMEECRAEGVNVDDIRCPDNTECLKLIMDNAGILGYLDEECKLGTGSDESFLQNVIQNCSKNLYFNFKPLQPGTFIVKHYAGAVTYSVKGWLEKNRDYLKDDMKAMMRQSSNALAQQCFPAPPSSSEGGTPTTSAKSATAPKTIGGFFKQQVSELMQVIYATNPHWIRCIKPHPSKKPLMFDGLQVIAQLTSSGVLGTVKIRKAGYPVRLTYHNFFARYKVLIGRCSTSDSVVDQHLHVRKAMRAANVTAAEVQCGKTRVFMKSDAFFEFEKAKDQAGMKHRLLLQAFSRATLAEMRTRQLRWAISATTIQDEYRDFYRRSQEVRVAKRIAREKLLAEQSAVRQSFLLQAVEDLTQATRDEEEAFANLKKLRRAHHAWLDDKLVSDARDKAQFVNQETAARTDFFNEYKAVLQAYSGMKFALFAMSMPEVEATKRSRTATDEMREFNVLCRLFREHGAAMFRVEVERQERRYRRVLMRLEDLQFLEARQRLQLLPEFIESLRIAVRKDLPELARIKRAATEVALRAARRQTSRERSQEVEFFSQRHPHDSTKLEREVAQLQMGVYRSPDTSYRREGDKKRVSQLFAADQAWQGVNGVPDIDQVLCGINFDKKFAKTARESKSRRREGSHEAEDSDLLDAFGRRGAKEQSPGGVVSLTEGKEGAAGGTDALKTTHVFECFRDKMDEMSFLRMRHLIAKEFRELAALGRYDGPLGRETEITNKRQFFSAQEHLQTLTLAFAESLVVVLRQLNLFCTTKHIPEQDQVTGEWRKFQPVKKEMVQSFPQFADWRQLLSEQKRLHYAMENYKGELIKVIRQCIARGARSTFDVDESSSVNYVHHCYEELRGHFDACSRCLFPMAPKTTLVTMRLLWPHVQDFAFPNRCRDCMAGVEGKELSPQQALTAASPQRQKTPTSARFR